MKKYFGTLILTITMLCSCESGDNGGIEYASNSPSYMVEHILRALNQEDFDHFKESAFSWQDIKDTDVAGYSKEKVDSAVKSLYDNGLRSVKANGVVLNSFKVLEVIPPYKSYEWEGVTLVSFEVMIEDAKGSKYKLDFSDCLKSENGYMLSENFDFKQQKK